MLNIAQTMSSLNVRWFVLDAEWDVDLLMLITANSIQPSMNCNHCCSEAVLLE